VFLERSGARAINSESLNPPKPDCSTCSFALVRVEIDPALATFNHLVESVLEKELGYDKELTIAIGNEMIYDPDFDDNLKKKLSDFGVSNESIITVTDDNDTDTRVNLEILIVERYACLKSPHSRHLFINGYPEPSHLPRNLSL
jgi:ubiquitin-like 1-activating enzyme E1 B